MGNLSLKKNPFISSMEEVHKITFCALLHYPTLHNYVWWILLCRHLSIYHQYPVISLKSHSQPDLSGKIKKPFLYSHQSRDSPLDQAWAPGNPVSQAGSNSGVRPHTVPYLGMDAMFPAKFGLPQISFIYVQICIFTWNLGRQKAFLKSSLSYLFFYLKYTEC